MSANILWTRVDNRLVHGQIGCLWVDRIKPDQIVIADDDAAEDKVQQSLMKMTADMYNVGIKVVSLAQCPATISAIESQSILLVVRNLSSARALVEAEVPIDQLNLGNLHFSEGKHVTEEPHVYLGEDDQQDIDFIKSRGISVFIQVAPGNPQIEM
ncbi:MAG: PTS sugar transporter subunit IIB [Erysipelotrichaceae bacterium]|nr:PTS sugar transporter subunit IIB [Erysipelotrichaceae bacterium]